MAEDYKLAIDESQRIRQHEAAQAQARNEVQNELAGRAGQFDERERAELGELGAQMKRQAVSEVAETSTEVQRARVLARISQVIDYLFYLVYGIIGLEIVFDLLGARKTNTIREVIDALAAPLLAPFQHLVPDPALGRFQFRSSYLIALVLYALLHLAINGLLRLMAQRKTTI
jgi:uncharacterized protein YggT (Ycf19 family)